MYLVLDLETDNREVYGRKGNPWHNNIVAIGYAHGGKARSMYYTDPGFDKIPQFLDGIKVIIGHNIKFDLLYLWKITHFQDWIKAGGTIFDTQLAEYILSGQLAKYNALRYIAVSKYGCKPREKLMEPYWDKGVLTSDIPKEIVLTDVENDALDTEQVALQQLKLLKEQGMYELVKGLNETLLATTEMEYNGFKVDRTVMLSNKASLEKELKLVYTQIMDEIKPYWLLTK